MALPKHLVQIVDEDRGSRRTLRERLEADGFRVVTSDTCRGAAQDAAARPPDVLIVLMGVQHAPGIGLIKSIREWSVMPILALCADCADMNPLGAFDAGADDYIPALCGAPEVVARVRAALRFQARGGWLPTGVLEWDTLSIDLGRRIVRRGERRGEELTRLEYRVLEALVRGRHRVVTQAALSTDVWGPGPVQSQRLRACVASLRRKLEIDPTAPSRIITELGVGYRLVTQAFSGRRTVPS